MNKYILMLIRFAIEKASPAIITDLRNAVSDMMVRAEATPNPFDDMFVGMLQLLVGKPGDTAQSSPDD